MSPEPTAPEPLRSADGSARPDPGGAAFWIGLLLGGSIMAFGIGGMLNDAAGTNPSRLALWAVGLLLVHDLVIAPVTAIVGWVLLRVVPHRVRGPVLGGLIVMAMAAVVAIPVVRGAGRRPDNRTILPAADYPTNLAVVLGAVAAATMLLVVVRAMRARRTSPPPPRPTASDG